jgi:WhiB family redox-sensing transcriptional regulator
MGRAVPIPPGSTVVLVIEPREDLAAIMRTRPGTDVSTASARLVEMLRRPAWQAEAACRGMGHRAFFVERGADVRAPKAICATCTVVDECRSYAAETGARDGIWAGVTAAKIRAWKRAA